MDHQTRNDINYFDDYRSPKTGLKDVYFSPSGRINRSTYWLKGVLLLNVIWLAITTIYYLSFLLAWDFVGVDMAGVFALLLLVIAVPIAWWNNYCVTVKRLHDRGRSAGFYWLWFILLIFLGWTVVVPVVVVVWAIVELGFLEGDLVANRYGHATTGQHYRRVEPSNHNPGDPNQVPILGQAQTSPQSSTSAWTKNCPYCAETIRYEVTTCPYCQSALGSVQANSEGQP